MTAKEREMPAVDGTLEGICPIHLQRYEFASLLVQVYRSAGPVYDIGCGCGYGSTFFDPRYVGIDNDAETIEYARKHYGNLGAVDFEVADARELSASLAKGSAAVTLEMVEHINEPEKLLDWARQHCGLFVCSTPIKGSSPQSPFHVREYTLSELKELLARYWASVKIFAQQDMEIRYPCTEDHVGAMIGVCW